jgi:adenylate kinase family enzyme
MSRVQIHTINQPDSDTTCFILSCNRMDELDKTLNSFLDTRDYVTKMVIVDDSAEEGVFETLVDKYGHISDVICFPRNRSQWWAMDFMVSYCDSEYIFYLEEDWELLQKGYLNQSKEILQKYRDIGTVDISWRTFEWQGIDSYEKELIDNQFYYKKYWQISDYHLGWYGWIGSPNLKRRDDLILLGRIEKWHNEWNIDRKFRALGFKGCFLKDKYAKHLGDHNSRMAGKRPDDSTVPENYFPEELKKDRIMPVLDYYFLDKHYRSPSDICLVSMLVNINRDDRNFKEHYLNSISKLLKTRHPIVLFAEEKYFEELKSIRGNSPMTLIPFSVKDIESFDLHKQKMLNSAMEKYNSSYFYWVDAGMFSSFNVPHNINNYYFTKIPKNNFYMSAFPYNPIKEIHGYNTKGLEEQCGVIPNRVLRATIFGGSRDNIKKITKQFYQQVKTSLDLGYIGTEEAIYTILTYSDKSEIEFLLMENGDINNFLKTTLCLR